MAKTVKWTEAALSDLEQIAEYISRDSAFYAATFVAKIRDAATTLSEFPERRPVVSEFNIPSIREIYIRDYRLIFDISNEIIYVLGIIHGARDLRSLWDNEGHPSSEE